VDCLGANLPFFIYKLGTVILLTIILTLHLESVKLYVEVSLIKIPLNLFVFPATTPNATNVILITRIFVLTVPLISSKHWSMELVYVRVDIFCCKVVANLVLLQ